MKELNLEELDKVSGGISVDSLDNNEKKWADVGVRIVYVNGFAEYYLIKDGTKISPRKALEIYARSGREL